MSPCIKLTFYRIIIQVTQKRNPGGPRKGTQLTVQHLLAHTYTNLFQKFAAESTGQLMAYPHGSNAPNSYLKVFEILRQFCFFFFFCRQYTVSYVSSYLLWNRRQFVLNPVLQTGGLIKQVYWLSLRLWLKTGKHVAPVLVFLSKSTEAAGFPPSSSPTSPPKLILALQHLTYNLLIKSLHSALYNF
jgi:hypothetical protein